MKNDLPFKIAEETLKSKGKKGEVVMSMFFGSRAYSLETG